MTQWYLNDDAGYLAWLAAHDDGFVLNTYAHIAAGYLVVHRARCRTINRDLAAGKAWTVQYGKACAEQCRRAVPGQPSGRMERHTAAARASRTCLRVQRVLGSAAHRPGGSRAVQGASLDLKLTGDPVTVTIRRVDGGPTLVIGGRSGWRRRSSVSTGAPSDRSRTTRECSHARRTTSSWRTSERSTGAWPRARRTSGGAGSSTAPEALAGRDRSPLDAAGAPRRRVGRAARHRPPEGGPRGDDRRPPRTVGRDEAPPPQTTRPRADPRQPRRGPARRPRGWMARCSSNTCERRVSGTSTYYGRSRATW